jgi:hypothetical protein
MHLISWKHPHGSETNRNPQIWPNMPDKWFLGLSLGQSMALNSPPHVKSALN